MQPETGFRVLHHYVEPDHSRKIVDTHTTTVGTYPSLTAAQAAALETLETKLATYHQAGLHGRTFKEINLVLRGLITVMTARGEQPRDEFEIQRVSVFMEPCSPPMGGEEERALFTSTEKATAPKPSVKLPPKASMSTLPPTLAPANRYAKIGFVQESDALWAQSRIPIFTKRDEGPFRGPSDPPYQEHMHFVRSLPKSQQWPIPQIVYPQPDGTSGTTNVKKSGKWHGHRRGPYPDGGLKTSVTAQKPQPAKTGRQVTANGAVISKGTRRNKKVAFKGVQDVSKYMRC